MLLLPVLSLFLCPLVFGLVFEGKRLDDNAAPLPLLVDRSSDADVDTKFLKHVVCRGPHLSSCPKFLSDCSRAVVDNQFPPEDIRALHGNDVSLSILCSLVLCLPCPALLYWEVQCYWTVLKD
jgi:hypothetical protein